jgi:hypothetical protein
MKNNWRSGVALACLMFAGYAHGADRAGLPATAQRLDAVSILTVVPILIAGDGQVAAKISGKTRTRFHYLDGVLTSSETDDGKRAEYVYQRDGVLERIVYASGIVQTPRFDEQGKLYGLVSSSGKALQLSGDVRSGRTMLVMPASALTVPAPAPGAGGASAAKEALVNLLIAADGWETQAGNGGENSSNGCDNNDDDAQQRVGPGQRQGRGVAPTPGGAEPAPVSMGCDIVIITGPGGGADGDGGGGGGAGSPGSGGVPSDYPPGTAGNDNPGQVPCLNGAYRAWQQMDALCRVAPTQREANECNAVKWRLYNEEIEYCKTL